MSQSFVPTPELQVTTGNKQGWNQPKVRRHGFHNIHKMFRRGLSFRASTQWPLTVQTDKALAARPEVALLTGRRECSALVVARGGHILVSHNAADFPVDQSHSIQSISKICMHLIAGELIAKGLLDPQIGRILLGRYR